MAGGTGEYIAFLVVGVVLVFIDGQLIRRGGQVYLAEVYSNASVAESMNRLVTALFHLTVLGVLALISTIDMDLGSALESVVARTGVMLLVLAAAHGTTILVLAKIRTRQREQRLRESITIRTEDALET